MIDFPLLEIVAAACLNYLVGIVAMYMLIPTRYVDHFAWWIEQAPAAWLRAVVFMLWPLFLVYHWWMYYEETRGET